MSIVSGSTYTRTRADRVQTLANILASQRRLFDLDHTLGPALGMGISSCHFSTGRSRGYRLDQATIGQADQSVETPDGGRGRRSKWTTGSSVCSSYGVRPGWRPLGEIHQAGETVYHKSRAIDDIRIPSVRDCSIQPSDRVWRASWICDA